MGGDVHFIGTDLAGNGDQRGPVAVGIGDASNQVGSTRPEGSHADAGFAGQTAVDVGHESGALFVADGDKFNLRMFQGIHDGEVFFAGDAENIMDAFFFQTFDEKVGGVARLLLFHGVHSFDDRWMS